MWLTGDASTKGGNEMIRFNSSPELIHWQIGLINFLFFTLLSHSRFLTLGLFSVGGNFWFLFDAHVFYVCYMYVLV
jgi:hypothetical protein